MLIGERRVTATMAALSLCFVAAALAGCGSDSAADNAASTNPSVTSPQSPDVSPADDDTNDDTNDDSTSDVKDDVKTTTCALDAASGKAVMKVDVTNNTAAEASYTFDVTIIAGPNKTPYAVTPLYPAFIQSLASGQTESVEYTTTAKVKDPVVCRINNLKRR